MDGQRKALLVASTGGHLEQMTRLEPCLQPPFAAIEYATFETEQSVSLLRGKTIHYVRTIPPRGLAEALSALPAALEVVRKGEFTDVISTGSGVAVPFLLAAAGLGKRIHYIESAARSQGPSLSGRLVSRLPSARLYTQYPNWAGRRWKYRGSVFDGFTCDGATRPTGRPARAVVTLGTMRSYSFGRAVDAVQRILAELGASDAVVLWQVGDTPTTERGINAHRYLPARQLSDAIRDADLVFSHAGIGSCLQILDAGHAPILFSRAATRGEHVDDHQQFIAKELGSRGLAVSREPEDLTVGDVVTAMSRRISKEQNDRPFLLQD